jgi:hypothetical protein
LCENDVRQRNRRLQGRLRGRRIDNGQREADKGKRANPARARRRGPLRIVWFCLPVVVWLAVITLASTNLGSQADSGPLLLRLVHFLLHAGPDNGAPSDYSALSWAVRKTAHIIEYAVLPKQSTIAGLDPAHSTT